MVNGVGFVISEEDLALGPGTKEQVWSLKNFCVAEFH